MSWVSSCNSYLQWNARKMRLCSATSSWPQSLLLQPPNRLLAIRLREACQQSVLRRSFLRSILPGTSASTWVVAGLAALLGIAIPIGAGLAAFLLPDDRIWQVALGVAVMGALGSVVSILVRIKDFTEIRILDPPALFWTGFFKPVIGASFALFVYMAIESNIINIFTEEIKDPTLFHDVRIHRWLQRALQRARPCEHHRAHGQLRRPWATSPSNGVLRHQHQRRASRRPPDQAFCSHAHQRSPCGSAIGDSSGYWLTILQNPRAM